METKLQEYHRVLEEYKQIYKRRRFCKEIIRNDLPRARKNRNHCFSPLPLGLALGGGIGTLVFGKTLIGAFTVGGLIYFAANK
jgi:hypothetical protein